MELVGPVNHTTSLVAPDEGLCEDPARTIAEAVCLQYSFHLSANLSFKYALTAHALGFVFISAADTAYRVLPAPG